MLECTNRAIGLLSKCVKATGKRCKKRLRLYGITSKKSQGRRILGVPVMQLTDVARLQCLVLDDVMEARLHLLLDEDVSSAQRQFAAAHAELLYFHICTFFWPKTALNDLFHSNQAFSEFPQVLSVDSSDES